MAKTNDNKFTQTEYTAYKLQIWRDTFHAVLQGTGGRDVTLAVASADIAVAGFIAQFDTAVIK